MEADVRVAAAVRAARAEERDPRRQPGAQEDRLVALLRKKGVLADGDVKTLRSKPRPVAVASGNPSSAPMAS